MATGARMAFDVASVRPDTSNLPERSRFPLGPGDAYAPGGLFSATNQPLIAYVRFAFKLGQGDLLGLPKWVYTERFDIEARAPGTPTKDHMRLMMQSLLSERFALKVHTETRTKPVLNLGVVKAGKTGPQLRVHPPGESCDVPSTLLPPIACGSLGPTPASVPGHVRLIGRRVTMKRISEFLMNPFTGIDRPVVDRTGLPGEFDFSLEWSSAPDSAAAGDSHVDDTGSTFLQALHDQLGLTLKSARGPVNVLVIDRIERPAPD